MSALAIPSIAGGILQLAAVFASPTHVTTVQYAWTQQVAVEPDLLLKDPPSINLRSWRSSSPTSCSDGWRDQIF
jgi:hypothetical protein